MSEEQRTQFDYLLNAFEQASQSARPADSNYAAKRKALYAYVRGLEAAMSQQVPAVREMLRKALVDIDHMIHCANADEIPFAGDETRELREEIMKYLAAPSGVQTDDQSSAIASRPDASVITDAQITAGAAIKCDHGKPIGRNAAIDVFEAMCAAGVQTEDRG